MHTENHKNIDIKQISFDRQLNTEKNKAALREIFGDNIKLTESAKFALTPVDVVVTIVLSVVSAGIYDALKSSFTGIKEFEDQLTPAEKEKYELVGKTVHSAKGVDFEITFTTKREPSIYEVSKILHSIKPHDDAARVSINLIKG